MPHKYNADRRNRTPKQKYRATNWAEYNEGLQRLGDLTVWISDAALGQWSAPRRTTRGGQSRYSDLAIELCLALGMAFNQPLRQTQGFMRSIAGLFGVAIEVPDFSTLSCRGSGLNLSAKPSSRSDTPTYLVVDSTGLKIFGEGEWLEEKHKNKAKRKSWRKLHLGPGLMSGEIVCAELTTDDIGDPTALPDLLDQVDGPVNMFLAEGAYDAEPTRDLLISRFGMTLQVAIPPPLKKCSSQPRCCAKPDNTRLRYSPGQQPWAAWADGLTKIVWLQSAQPHQNTNGPLENGNRNKVKGTRLRKPKDSSWNRRPDS